MLFDVIRVIPNGLETFLFKECLLLKVVVNDQVKHPGWYFILQDDP